MTPTARCRSAFIALSLFIGAPNGAPAEELGRLFFSAEQRAALDRTRTAGAAAAGAGNGSGRLAVNGEVRRSAGGGTIWINERAHHTAGGELVAEATTAPGRVVLSGTGLPRVELKIGTTLDLEAMKAVDPMAENPIVIHHRQAAHGRD